MTSKLRIRPVLPSDSKTLKRVIETVMPEFHACGKGFALSDPEVQDMYNGYQGPGKLYLVAELNGEVVGGGGVMSLKGGPAGVCELQKMYLFKEGRGQGLGKMLLQSLIAEARKLGYSKMYLETLKGMKAAQTLYQSFGFKKVERPCGDTGHFMCDTYYELSL